MKKIVICGGGVIGLSIAHALSSHNYEVHILEKETIGSQASSHAAGMLAAQSEFDQTNKLMPLCIQSRDMYRLFVSQLELQTGMSVGYSDAGIIRPARNEQETELLHAVSEWQSAAGHDVQELTDEQLHALEPQLSKTVHAGLLAPDDGIVNNNELVTALKTACIADGVQMQEHVSVDGLIVQEKKVTGVTTSAGTIDADIVINAMGAWSSALKHELLPNVAVKPIRGQMISFNTEQPVVKHTIFAGTQTNNKYIVPRKGEIIVGATVEDVGFESAIQKESTNTLHEFAASIVPALAHQSVAKEWVGFRPATEDRLPIIGKTPIENFFMATAHFRNGILLAPITAHIIEQMITKQKEFPELQQFSIDRFN